MYTCFITFSFSLCPGFVFSEHVEDTKSTFAKTDISILMNFCKSCWFIVVKLHYFDLI